jgi:N-acetylmuramoyl-L-alanine amidase
MELLSMPLRLLFRLLPAGMLWLLVGSQAAQAVWDVRKHDGEDYVAVDSIKQYVGYKFKNLTRAGNAVTLESPNVVMKLAVGSADCTMNRVKFVFSKPVVDINSRPYVSRTDLSKLIDPVLRPNFIKNAGNFRTVILDPGHGGRDPGATSSYGNEATYTLQTAKLLRAELIRLGFKVVMTRADDRFLTLQERVNAANAVRENALFISIHFNSGGRAAHGIETFTLSPPGVAHYGRGEVAADSLLRTGNAHDSANVALATSIHGAVTRNLVPLPFDRGIKRARYTVISGVRHPAVLLEGGFLSNPDESKLIHQSAYQATLARSVAAAVRKYQLAVARTPAARPN